MSDLPNSPEPEPPARNGTQMWRAIYVGPQMEDAAIDVAVGPYGTRIFVTGQSWGNFNTSNTALPSWGWLANWLLMQEGRPDEG